MNTVTVEGNSIADALRIAADQMGAAPTDLKWTLDKEHFPAMTVRIFVEPMDEATIAERKAQADRSAAAVKWIEGALEKFGTTDASVRATISGSTLTVSIETEEDSGLLIGKEGKNLEALQLLFRQSMQSAFEGMELVLDVGGYRGRERNRDDRPRRDRDDRGRGRGRDRDDRGRGRGRGRDRDDRRGGSKDPARDEELKVRVREAAEKTRDTGESVRFTDLNSYERYLAHTVVKEVDGVDSRSVGKGGDKAVEVFKKD